MTEDFIDRLRKIANRDTWDEDEDFNPYDFCGGNYDDAYWAGTTDGETKLARQIIQQLD